jgi:membrane associated rhomboid family serine protease
MPQITITLLIIIVTCGVSFLCFQNENLFNKLKHFPYAEHRHKEFYRWLTSGFVHGNIMHLFLNMFVFHSFGSYVEKAYKVQYGALGGTVFLLVYLLTIAIANVPTFQKHHESTYYSGIGASGGVAGILFIAILLQPWASLMVMFIPGVPAIVFGVLYLLYESYAAKNVQDNIGHDTHFMGALVGILLAAITLPGILKSFVQDIFYKLPF